MNPLEAIFKRINDSFYNSKHPQPHRDINVLKGIKNSHKEAYNLAIDDAIEKLKEFGEQYRKEEIEEITLLKKKI